MDPLSVSVSAIALVGATKQVAKGLSKLASLRGAPAAVLALNNEVSDVRLVLDEAQPLLVSSESEFDEKSGDGIFKSRKEILKASIERANDRLVELEAVVQNRLMSRMGAKDRLGWLMEQGRVRKALEDLHIARLNITAIIGVRTS